jgi:hypothetical protein
MALFPYCSAKNDVFTLNVHTQCSKIIHKLYQGLLSISEAFIGEMYYVGNKLDFNYLDLKFQN